MNRTLKDSYLWCWKVVRKSGSSFYRSFFLLRQPARNSMAALYAFSRITDDLGDRERDDSAVGFERPGPIEVAVLDAWIQRLRKAVGQSAAVLDNSAEHTTARQATAQQFVAQFEPLWPALVDTVEQYNVPIRYLEDIAQGVTMDLDEVRFDDWCKLEQYCYHVASAVGLACTHIWNASNDLPDQTAVDCGVAFQLTNIVRDVSEDAARGRIYVPRPLLSEFACSEAAWLSGRPDGDWLGLIDAMCDKAKPYYESGWETRSFLDSDGQRMFSLIWRTYRRLLDEVHKNKSHLWSQTKVQLPRTQRFLLASSHFVPAWYRTLRPPHARQDLRNES